MKITAVNFADDNFSKQQKYSSWSLKNLGKVHDVISYSTKDIKSYLEKYPHFKKYYHKGYGNYFWKPYIIQKALETLKEGDFLIYMDSGTFTLKNLSPLCNYLDKIGKDILVFESPLIQKQWTKMDTFILLKANEQKYFDVCQLAAAHLVIKNTSSSREFIENYRSKCTDERIVSDLNNVLGFPNDLSFEEHRHDQSVLTILSHQSPIVKIEKDLSDYGIFPEGYLTNTSRLFDKSAFDAKNYKFSGFVLSNRKVHPLKYLIKYLVKRVLRLVDMHRPN